MKSEACEIARQQKPFYNCPALQRREFQRCQLLERRYRWSADDNLTTATTTSLPLFLLGESSDSLAMARRAEYGTYKYFYTIQTHNSTEEKMASSFRLSGEEVLALLDNDDKEDDVEDESFFPRSDDDDSDHELRLVTIYDHELLPIYGNN